MARVIRANVKPAQTMGGDGVDGAKSGNFGPGAPGRPSMNTQAHTRTPLLMDRQLNQRDPVPSVPKNIGMDSPGVKAKANKNDRVVEIRNDCDNADSLTHDSDDYSY